jgi:hypothetical protein
VDRVQEGVTGFEVRIGSARGFMFDIRCRDLSRLLACWLVDFGCIILATDSEDRAWVIGFARQRLKTLNASLTVFFDSTQVSLSGTGRDRLSNGRQAWKCRGRKVRIEWGDHRALYLGLRGWGVVLQASRFGASLSNASNALHKFFVCQNFFVGFRRLLYMVRGGRGGARGGAQLFLVAFLFGCLLVAHFELPHVRRVRVGFGFVGFSQDQ